MAKHPQHREHRSTWRRTAAAAGLLLAGVLAPSARAQVALELQPLEPSYAPGEVVRVALVAHSESEEGDETVSAANVILTWDPAHLELLGVDDTGGPGLLSSGFPGDPFGLNDDLTDGDGLYVAFAPLGSPIVVPTTGILLTTLEFLALEPTPSTPVDIPATGGVGGETVVYDGEIAGLEITGTLSGTAVAIVETCAADLDADGMVGFSDLVILLAAWGPCPPAEPCPPDLDGDDDVGFGDLVTLLAAWGACP